MDSNLVETRLTVEAESIKTKEKDGVLCIKSANGNGCKIVVSGVHSTKNVYKYAHHLEMYIYTSPDVTSELCVELNNEIYLKIVHTDPNRPPSSVVVLEETGKTKHTMPLLTYSHILISDQDDDEEDEEDTDGSYEKSFIDDDESVGRVSSETE